VNWSCKHDTCFVHGESKTGHSMRECNNCESSLLYDFVWPDILH